MNKICIIVVVLILTVPINILSEDTHEHTDFETQATCRHYDNFTTNTNAYTEQETGTTWTWILDTTNETFTQNRSAGSWKDNVQIITNPTGYPIDTPLNMTEIGDRLVFSGEMYTTNNDIHLPRVYFCNNSNFSQGNGYGIFIDARSSGGTDYAISMDKTSDNSGVFEDHVNVRNGPRRYVDLQVNVNYTITWSIIKVDASTILHDFTVTAENGTIFDTLHYYDSLIIDEGFFGFGDRGYVGQQYDNVWNWVKIEEENNVSLVQTEVGAISNIAHSGSEVLVNLSTGEALKINFVEDDIVRMRLDIGFGYGFSDGNEFTLDNVTWTNPNITNVSNATHWIYQTDITRVTLTKTGNLSYAVYRNDSASWTLMTNSTDGAFGYNLDNRSFALYNKPSEYFYGLTDNGHLGDLEQKVYRITRNQSRIVQAAHGQIVAPYIHSTDGYGIFYDTTYTSNFNYSNSSIKFNYTAGDSSVKNLQLDIYFLIENNTNDQITRYTDIVGRYEMPPKWSAGYMITRYLSDSEWNISQYSYSKQVYIEDAIRNYRQKNIPMDMFIFDYGWYGGRDVETPYDDSFTWDNLSKPTYSHFPEYQTMLNNFTSNNTMVTGIRKPIIEHTGFPTDYLAGSYLNVFKEDAREYYWDMHTTNQPRGVTLLRNLTKGGISGWWLDESDPNAPFTNLINFYDDTNTTRYGYEVKNIYTQMWAKSFWDGMRTDSNNRTWIVGRSGYAGMQQSNLQVWTGDIGSYMTIIPRQPQSILNGGMIGVPYVSFDAGGFTGDCDNETFTRWMQLGLFSPMYRAHSSSVSKPRFPWLFGSDAENITKNANEWRMKSIPYIYTEYFNVHKTGLPICKPLVLEYPNDSYVTAFANASKQERLVKEWIFGDLLVSPVMEDKANTGYATMNIYLPEGNWLDWFTFTNYTGGQEITYDISSQANRISGITNTNWNCIPVFQRENSIIPIYKEVRQYWNDTSNPDAEDIILRVNPSQTIGELYTYQFYDDDGISYDYQSDNYIIQNFTMNKTKVGEQEIINISIGDNWHSFIGNITKRDYDVYVYAPDGIINVSVSGAEGFGYYFNSTTNMAIINISNVSLIDSTETYIEIFANTPPTITYLSPANNVTIQSPVTITCNATDNTELKNVSLYFLNDSTPLYENYFTTPEVPHLASWTADNFFGNKADWNDNHGELQMYTGGGMQILYTGSDWNNYTYQALVRRNGTNPMGITFVYQDQNNYWRYISEGGRMLIRGKVGSVWQNAGGWGAGEFAVDDTSSSTWYWYKVKVNTTHICCKHWQLGSSEPDWERTIPDTNLTHGKIAVTGWNGETQFDNLSVYGIDSSYYLVETKPMSGQSDNVSWEDTLDDGLYYWKLQVCDENESCVWSEERNFTVQTPNVTCSFATICDMRMPIYGDNGIKQAMNFINNNLTPRPDYVFVVGDWEWTNITQEFLNSTGWYVNSSTDFHVVYVMGNHDEPDQGDAWFQANIAPKYPYNNTPAYANSSFPGTVLSFNHGDACIVVTNQYWNDSGGGYCDDQRAWMNSTFENNSDKQIFVFGHEPFFPLNRHIGDSLDQDVPERNAVWDSFIKHNVSAFYNGHTHYTSIIEYPGFSEDGVCVQVDCGADRGHNDSGNPIVTVSVTSVYDNGSALLDVYEGYNNGTIQQFNQTYQETNHWQDNSGNLYSPFWVPLTDSNEFTGKGAIQSGDADAEERTDTHVVDIYSADLEILYDPSDAQQEVGLMYLGCYIPQGAAIKSAYFDLTDDNDGDDGSDVNISIWGHNVDNSWAFEASNYNISGRTKTDVSILWYSDTAWTAYSTYQSPDISSVIQEIVDRPEWKTGNNLCLILNSTDTLTGRERTAQSYGTGLKSSRFVVTWVTSGVPTIECKSPADGETDVNTSVTCEVYVNDTDGDNLNITWATNESGSWTNKHTNTSVTANTTVSYQFTDFDSYNTTYYWRVYANDGTVNVSETYHFTTTSLSINISEPYPSNLSTEVSRPPSNLSANITGDNMDVYFYLWNTTPLVECWTQLANWSGISNSRVELTNLHNFDTDFIWGNTSYSWTVNITDGSTWINNTYNYATIEFISGKNARCDIDNNGLTIDALDLSLDWSHRTTGGHAVYNRMYDVRQDNNVNTIDLSLIWANRT